MIDNHKAHGEWKTQLAMQIKFVFSLAADEFRISDNVETLIGTETDDVINELFKSFFQKYQERL